MQTLRTDYLSAYRSLRLTRDAKGVLIALNFIPAADRLLSRHKIIRSLSTPFTGLLRIERTRS